MMIVNVDQKGFFPSYDGHIRNITYKKVPISNMSIISYQLSKSVETNLRYLKNGIFWDQICPKLDPNGGYVWVRMGKNVNKPFSYQEN